MRQYASYLWYERAETNFTPGPGVRLRPRRGQGRGVGGEDRPARPRSTWPRRGGSKPGDERAIAGRDGATSSRSSGPACVAVEQRDRATAEPSHVAALRRPSPRGPIAARFTASEEGDGDRRLLSGKLREEDGLGHEEAVRDAVVGVLMSPHFCYRVDLPGEGGAGGGIRPLSDDDAGQPAELFPLVEHARRADYWPAPAAGDLHQARGTGRPRPGGCSATAGPAAWATRVRRQLARLPPLRGAQRRRPRPVPEPSTTSCGGRCSRSRLQLLPRRRPPRPAGPVNSSTAGTPSSTRPWHGTTACPIPPGRARGCLDVGSTTRRSSGRGGLLPMAVFLTKNAPGLRHQPGEARVLGRPPPPRREHPAPAGRRARAAERRVQARRADIARGPGKAPGSTRAAPAATSGSTPSAWPSRATARSGEARKRDLGGRAGRRPGRLPRRGRGGGGRGPAGVSDDERRRRGVRREPLPEAPGLCPRPDPDPLGRRHRRGQMRARLAADSDRFGRAWSRGSSRARNSGTSDSRSRRRRG